MHGLTLRAAVLLLLISTFIWACDDDKKNDADAGTDTDTDTDTDSDADAGDPGRGDPADFPTDCFDNCLDACNRLDECNGADHPTYPLEKTECEELCELSINGPMWDDVSEHFRCCTSQEECNQVAGCGGWLSHPDTVPACNILCDCFFGGSALGDLHASLTPPDGYSWAPSTVVMAPEFQSVDYTVKYGAKVVDSSRFGIIRFEKQLSEIAARELADSEELLPTFVDTAGRIAAARGGIVVKVSTDTGRLDTEELLAPYGMELTALPFANDLHFADGDDGWLALDLIHELNAIPSVHAELDMLRLYETRMTPNDPMFGDQWHLLNTGQADPEVSGGPSLSVHGADSRVSEAWDTTTGSSDVVVAILDDGVNLNHPDLTGNLKPEYNFDPAWESYLGSTYLTGHGTQCAGVAAAKGNNSIGVSGVCPDCGLLPAMLMGANGPPTSGGFQVTDQELATIFTELVDPPNNAAVISNSWGPAGEDPNVESSGFTAPGLSSIVSSAFDYAESHGRSGLGTLILFASGNSNQDCDNDTYVAHANVVAVGAVDDQGLKSYYSNYGDTLDVVAPSNGGKNGITTTATSVDAATSPEYSYDFGGTSSACPFAAGVAGLIISANPALTAAQVRQILMDSASKVDPVWGEWSSDFSVFYGNGVVNAYTAVQMATGSCTLPENCPAPTDVCSGTCNGQECDDCRTDADCDTGYSCQALPALGAAKCVRHTAVDDCAADFEFVNDHCIPTRQACSMCSGSEVCNSRDDDCNGQVDDGIDCDGTPRCLQQGWGCPSDTGCAATVCMDSCDDDDGCEESSSCKNPKTRYGAIGTSQKVCDSGNMGCSAGCKVLASSLEDEPLAEFVDCVLESTNCMTVFTDCASALPINF